MENSYRVVAKLNFLTPISVPTKSFVYESARLSDSIMSLYADKVRADGNFVTGSL